MSDNLRQYVHAVYTMDAVVQRVPHDAWDLASPCEDWTAREVLGHVMWGLKALTAALIGDDRPAEQPEAEVAGPDPVASWNLTRDAALGALDRHGALQTMVSSPAGRMPADDVLAIFMMDPVIHAWDLATATGVEPAIAPDLAEVATEVVRGFGAGARGPGLFGPEIDPPAGTDAGARMAAFAGRKL